MKVRSASVEVKYEGVDHTFWSARGNGNLPPSQTTTERHQSNHPNEKSILAEIIQRTLCAVSKNEELEPEINRIELIGDQVEVGFSEILQWSSALLIWEDLDPQPESPYRFTPDTARMFFRARSR